MHGMASFFLVKNSYFLGVVYLTPLLILITLIYFFIDNNWDKYGLISIIIVHFFLLFIVIKNLQGYSTKITMMDWLPNPNNSFVYINFLAFTIFHLIIRKRTITENKKNSE